MKNTTLLCAVAVAGLFAGNAQAIYKCTTPKGVVYQDRPCKEGAESDVSIVNNTIDLQSKGNAAQDDPSPANAPRQDGKSSAAKANRTTDDAMSQNRTADNRSNNANGSDATSKRNGIRTVESVLPMSVDEARRTEPSAKYYTTDGASPGADTPSEMTCESPNGEKRRFILSNGKMTSI